MERCAPHVLLVTIDRPSALNAVNYEVADGLARAVQFSEEDDDIWAVVLTGAGGKAFCAGADLNDVAAGDLSRLFLHDGGFAGFVRSARTRVWIAAVDGFALAGGFEIALACDMIVATASSSFGLPEVKRGLIASGGGVYRLPRALPRNIALELIATGARLSCARAHALGMVNHIAEDGEAVTSAIQLASVICENAPIAVRESLTIARQTHDFTDGFLDRLSQRRQSLVMSTCDFAEGVRAFLEKRLPTWVSK
jgi:enoyl-CoA hydratase